MAKDRKGNFHPLKGKPSGSKKEDTSFAEEVEATHVMHPNRNVNKDEGDYVEKPDTVSYRSKTHKRSHLPAEEQLPRPEELSGPVTKEMIRELAGQGQGA